MDQLGSSLGPLGRSLDPLGLALDLLTGHGIEQGMEETDFLCAIAQRTGCGLLLDVNNVFVSATNLKLDARAYIDDFPLAQVGEIHLGGHDEEADDHGAPLLIDSHGAEIADPVWALLDYTLERSGPKPLLIEWDTDVPDWPVLAGEAKRGARALAPSLALAS